MSKSDATPATWIHEVDETESVEQLVRRAMKVVESSALPITPAKVSRLVRAQIRKHGSVMAAAMDLDAYFLNYSDPTGETAVRNVMAGAIQ